MMVAKSYDDNPITFSAPEHHDFVARYFISRCFFQAVSFTFVLLQNTQVAVQTDLVETS